MRRASAWSTGAEIPCAFSTFTPKWAILARTRGFACRSSSRRTLAFVHAFKPAAASTRLEHLVRIEEDRDRAFIHQLHRHHGLKHTCAGRDTERAELGHKLFVEHPSHLRRRCREKA